MCEKLINNNEVETTYKELIDGGMADRFKDSMENKLKRNNNDRLSYKNNNDNLYSKSADVEFNNRIETKAKEKAKRIAEKHRIS